jgi:hypothetical protein
VANSHPFAKNILTKEYSDVISRFFFGKKNRQKKKKNPIFKSQNPSINGVKCSWNSLQIYSRVPC